MDEVVSGYFMAVVLIIVFNVHPEVVADPESTILDPVTYIPKLNVDVFPKSTVVVSVKLADVPDHIPTICPALAFDPDFNV